MSRPIFNSLGAHYSWEFVGLALWQLVRARSGRREELTKKLSEQFQGKARLFYKGRDAIEYALRVIARSQETGKEKPIVFTQAFACYAIEEAILRAGWQPAYVDITEGDLNPSVATLNQALEKYDPPAALIIQHTLGQPADITAIRAWCDEHSVFLIEDTAQGFDQREYGTKADIVVTSFGRDKVIDAVAGGAAIISAKKPDLITAASNIPLSNQVSIKTRVLDMWYPGITSKIRVLFSISVWLGKVTHFVARKLGLLTIALYSPTKQMSVMPSQYATLALFQLQKLPAQLSHQKKIAKEYQRLLRPLITADERIEFIRSTEQIKHGTNLRFPLLCQDKKLAQAVVSALRKQRIFIADRWYRQAVDMSSLTAKSMYKQGSCPQAELTASGIINLPTHQKITLEKVSIIVKTLKEALTTETLESN